MIEQTDRLQQTRYESDIVVASVYKRLVQTLKNEEGRTGMLVRDRTGSGIVRDARTTTQLDRRDQNPRAGARTIGGDRR